MPVLLLALAYPATIAVLFYLAFLRPVQQSQKKQRDELASLRVGDEVLTQAGFLGIVKDIRVPEEHGPTDIDQAMDGAKDIIERRINKSGLSETEVTREGKNRLVVQVPGIDPKAAGDLIGKTALLEFRQPVRNDQNLIICAAADGSEFAVASTAVNVSRTPSGTGSTAKCADPATRK